MTQDQVSKSRWRYAVDEAYSKLPSTYLTIKDVLPICESPTIPTFRTTLYAFDQRDISVSESEPLGSQVDGKDTPLTVHPRLAVRVTDVTRLSRVRTSALFLALAFYFHLTRLAVNVKTSACPYRGESLFSTSFSS